METIATRLETPASRWQNFAGGRNPNLLRSLRSAMETNLIMQLLPLKNEPQIREVR